MNLTEAQIHSLAPDAGSAANGRKLAAAKNWQGLGRSERALWGSCQGSALYQVQVALGDFASKCSCPSRKFPCKHGLGLMFLAALAPEQVAAGAEPEWVSAWLDKRDQTVKAKETRASAPADPAQQARRAARRLSRVTDGVALMDTWMEDLIRQGLAGLERQPERFWEESAARLVDAQAPGLAARVRRMATLPGSGADWPEKLLGQLGRAALLSQAFRGLEAHEKGFQADVKQLLGFTLTEDEVRVHGDVARDRWQVVGQWIESEARSLGAAQQLFVQRTWLRGEASGKWALVLQFDVRSGRQRPQFAMPLMLGTAFEAELAYWPSAAPQRALVAQLLGPVEPAAGAPAGTAIAPMLDAAAEALAALPWIERTPCLLEQVTIAVDPAGGWLVQDAAGAALPLVGSGRWELLALTGGHPVTVAGEWDGEAVRPLAAWIAGRAVAIAREEA